MSHVFLSYAREDREIASSLAAAMRNLLDKPTEIATLSAQARARRFKSWNDYANELTTWMATLGRRN